MKTIELSDKDRLMLVNQFKILDLLNNNHDHENWIKILESGFVNNYQDLFFNISPEVSADVCERVYRILDLYRAIDTYKFHNPNDTEVISNHDSSFHGFDTNYELDHYVYANFLFANSKYEESAPKKSERQFGISCLSKYVPMLRLWSTFDDSMKLTREQVLQILNCPRDEMYAHSDRK